MPQCGSGALLYYQRFSEPETARFILAFLKPGMVFVDVGAHLGEYSLLAAEAVRPGGTVHAFEPCPAMAVFLRENIRRNRHTNVMVNELAVADSEGTCSFDECREPAVSSLRVDSSQSDVPGTTLTRNLVVKTTTLDTHMRGQEGRVDLIKIDVEGAELLALRGASRLLSKPPGLAPTLVIEYSSENYARFAYSGADILALLSRHGYQVYICTDTGTLMPFDPAKQGGPTVNIIAVKSRDEQERLQVVESSDAALLESPQSSI